MLLRRSIPCLMLWLSLTQALAQPETGLPELDDQLTRMLGRSDRLKKGIRALELRWREEFNMTERTKLLIRLNSKREDYRRLRQKIEFRSNPYLQRAISLVDEIVERSYPGLRSKRFSFHPLAGDSAFFSSFFSFSEPFLKRNRTYRLGVNLDAFRAEDTLPDSAMRAILAHELAHSLYFSQRNFFRVFGVVRIFISKKQLYRFERRADIVAISRGYAVGLIEYREWIYGRIPGEALESKKKTYLTPDEIRLVDEALRNHPQLLDGWLRRPPLDREEIEEAVQTVTLLLPPTSPKAALVPARQE